MSAEPSIRAVTTATRRAAQLGAVALVVLAACGPSPGDPCEPDPDAPGIGFRADGCGPDRYCEMGIYCVGLRPGCGDDVPFRYEWVRDNLGSVPPVCGCDGETYWFGTEEPRVRWRFYGSCDDCVGVSYGRGWYYPGFPEDGTPVNPACTECRDARRTPEGDCVGADGSPRAWDCCNCSYELLDGEQVCVGVTGEVLEDACCESR